MPGPGTALDVWEIIAGYKPLGRDRLLEETGLAEGRLDAALAYYEAHKSEVDEKIAENDQPLEHWRERYPNLNIQTVEH